MSNSRTLKWTISHNSMTPMDSAMGLCDHSNIAFNTYVKGVDKRTWDPVGPFSQSMWRRHWCGWWNVGIHYLWCHMYNVNLGLGKHILAGLVYKLCKLYAVIIQKTVFSAAIDGLAPSGPAKSPTSGCKSSGRMRSLSSSPSSDSFGFAMYENDISY